MSSVLTDRTRKLPAVLHTDFRPPHRDLKVVRRWFRLLPALMRKWCSIVEVDILPEDVRRLQALGGRVLITPNHPTVDDPVIMFALSRAADVPFYYLATREIFDDVHGLKGRLLQSLGAYSVVRGTADRESFRTTRELLTQPDGRVVIFPEGEIYSQNDTLLPFQSGVVQLAFWAMDDLRKAGEEKPSVKLLPVAIRYRYTQDMTRAIDGALSELEEALDLPPNPPRPPAVDEASHRYGRLRQVGRTILRTIELEYGLKTADDDEDLSERMTALKRLLLSRAASLVGVTFAPNSTLTEQMRQLVNAVYAVTRDEVHEKWSSYREKLHREQAERVRPLLADLNRVANWIAVTDNYVRSHPTPDRMGDNIRRLQIEAFDEFRLVGSRRVIIRIGEPIDLADYFDAYRADRRSVVNQCVSLLEQKVQSLLDSSQHQ
jgi:1-acyl-sn-glycerol-3-phosphate acyltransferase